MDVAEMALYAGQTSNIIYPDTPEKTKKMKLCTSVYFNENLRLGKFLHSYFSID